MGKGGVCQGHRAALEQRDRVQLRFIGCCEIDDRWRCHEATVLELCRECARADAPPRLCACGKPVGDSGAQRFRLARQSHLSREYTECHLDGIWGPEQRRLGVLENRPR